MNANLTVLPEPVMAGTTSRLTGQIVDENNEGFKPDTVVLTLFDKNTRSIINGRDEFDVRPLVSDTGLLSFELTPADNTIVNSIRRVEVHEITIEWTWSGGNRKGAATIEFTLKERPGV